MILIVQCKEQSTDMGLVQAQPSVCGSLTRDGVVVSDSGIQHAELLSWEGSREADSPSLLYLIETDQ